MSLSSVPSCLSCLSALVSPKSFSLSRSLFAFLSLSYSKPYGLIGTMCVFDDYRGSSVWLWEPHSTQRWYRRCTHVYTHMCLHHASDPAPKKPFFQHRKEAISKSLLLIHAIVVNIFRWCCCEVTISLTTRISVRQKWKWGDELLCK